MKNNFFLLLILFAQMLIAQDIRGIMLFNPETNDETPVISNNQQLILKFDDLTNASTVYRYTIKHYDRNWNDDGLFFTEFAKGPMNGLIDQFQYSFNTYQKYTHYELQFPNDKIQPLISGNFELIVYKDSPSKPLFKKRFMVVENQATLAVDVSRITNSTNPQLNQRIQVQAVGLNDVLSRNLNSVSLTVLQNNNWREMLSNLRPTSSLGNKILFQQMALAFPGNNEFYYFNNRTIDQSYDMVSKAENQDGILHTYLAPVWAFPLNYQYQPDVNGAYYFRSSRGGNERDANREGDYSWVHFFLESEPVDKKIYVLGGFNDYLPSEEAQMKYNDQLKAYEAKMYLKQGFYNYLLATDSGDGKLNFGEINGNFWQTENLYQALLYYQPFGRNYDGLMGYGEFRTPVK